MSDIHLDLKDAGDWTKQYLWRPKSDITAYELALAVPILVLNLYDIETAVKSLPESVQRHFKEAV